MSAQELIDLVSTLTEETDSDILSTYIDQAGDIVLRHAYPFDDTQTEVPAKYQRVQADIAVYLLNKRGAEGQLTHTENGISRSYENGDIPVTILRRIMPMVGVVSSSTGGDDTP